MFEGTYSPPFYLDLYNFKDGAQNDIFQNSYPNGLPPPGPNSTIVPTPVPFNAAAAAAVTPSPAVASSAVSTTPESTNAGQTSASASASLSLASASSAIPASSNPSQHPSATAAPSSLAAPSAEVSVVVSTSIVVSTQVSTQVVTITASVPPVPTNPPPSPLAASSTVTEYSFQFVTVTAPPVIVTSVPSAAFASGSALPDAQDVRAATSTNAVTTIDLNPPTVTPISSAVQNNTRLVDVDNLQVNEAVITSVANLTAPSPSAVSSSQMW